MDIRELSNFVRIVELGSLSRAAEVLRIGQPALGLQVRNLETELNQKLLIRHSRGVAPTDAGRVLIEHAKIIMGDIANAKRAIGGLNEPIGSVVLGMTASANGLFLCDLYHAVAESFPMITLNVVEALSGTLLEKLTTGEVELACLYSQAPVKGLVCEPLIDDRWVFVSAAAKRPPQDVLTFREVCAYPLILPSQISGMRSRLENVAESLGLSLKIALEVQSESLMRRLIERGIGHTVLSSNAVRSDVGLLHTAEIVDPPFPSKLCLMYAERQPLGRAAGTVRRLVLDLATKHEGQKRNIC